MLAKTSCHCAHMRWPVPGSHRSRIKQGSLVTPCIPTGPRLAGEDFKVGAARKPLDAPIDFIGLSAVLSAGLDHEALNILCHARRCAPRSQQALLDVGPRPISETCEEVLGR